MRTIIPAVICIALGVGALDTVSGQSQYEYPSYNGCISGYYDAERHGWYTFRNACTMTLDVTYMARKPPYGAGTATVAPGRDQSTGQSRSEVAERGGFFLYVCPEGLLPVDGSDHYVRRPEQPFHCKRLGGASAAPESEIEFNSEARTKLMAAAHDVARQWSEWVEQMMRRGAATHSAAGEYSRLLGHMKARISEFELRLQNLRGITNHQLQADLDAFQRDINASADKVQTFSREVNRTPVVPSADPGVPSVGEQQSAIGGATSAFETPLSVPLTTADSVAAGAISAVGAIAGAILSTHSGGDATEAHDLRAIVSGTVVNTRGEPLDHATVKFELSGDKSRSYKVTTDKSGRFFKEGLVPGDYQVTAEDYGVRSAPAAVSVRLGRPEELDFTLRTKEEATAERLLKEGVAAVEAGRMETALARYSEAAALLPACYDCYYNIGFVHARQKEYDKAEKAFQRAIELKPDYKNAYNGLATIYNAQGRFEEAWKASERATSSPSATSEPMSANPPAPVAAPGARNGAMPVIAPAPGVSAASADVELMYSEGVKAWNAANVEAAKARFEASIRADPKHANSHYQLGMCLVNLGKLREAANEFQTYLELAPNGKFADTARAILASLRVP